MAPKRVAIGVVGLGRMGKRHVYNLMSRVPRAQVVAVCTNLPHEIEWARANQEHKDFDNAVYDDYAKMLSHLGLQAVCVSTSTDVHASQTLMAVDKGLHVMCGKPISTDLGEYQRVVDRAAEKPNLKVMAAFSRRFDASYRDAAKQILDDGAIGNPFLVRNQTCDLLDTTGFLVCYATRNSGIFVDCAIHGIDLTLWYLSGPFLKPAGQLAPCNTTPS